MPCEKLLPPHKSFYLIQISKLTAETTNYNCLYNSVMGKLYKLRKLLTGEIDEYASIKLILKLCINYHIWIGRILWYKSVFQKTNLYLRGDYETYIIYNLMYLLYLSEINRRLLEIWEFDKCLKTGRFLWKTRYKPIWDYSITFQDHVKKF